MLKTSFHQKHLSKTSMINKNFYKNYLIKQLDKIKSENRYRVFNKIEKYHSSYPNAYWVNNDNKKKVIIWCSNDYLGMSQKEVIIKAAKQSLTNYGTGSGDTRNISGNHLPIVKLEEEIATLHQKESALVFTSGYIANESTISSLLKLFRDCVVFSDEKNHASIISGIQKSSNNKFVFLHNDLNDLERKLKLVDRKSPKIIIFESIYSMDGSIGNIEGIVALAKKYNCLTYIDEVHAVGMYGKSGAGITEETGLQNDIDIIQGTLAKAYGNIGGYIASDKLICDFVRSSASGFIFTTTIPPAAAEASIKSIQYLKKSSSERCMQKENVIFLKNKLIEEEISFLNNKSHIVPIMINDAYKCNEISELLLKEYGHYIQPINYPTVPKGTERLRVTPGPLHTKEMMIDLVKCFKICIQESYN